jgi:hypothetical protein
MNLGVKVKVALLVIVVFGGIALAIDKLFDMPLYAPLGAAAAVLFVLATRKKANSDLK